MAIGVHCECGATFELSDRYAGRDAHCIECGASLHVPDPLALADDGLIPLADEAPASAKERTGNAQIVLPPIPTTESLDPERDARSRARAVAERNAISAPEIGFWPDAVRGFYLFLEPSNLATCLMVWFLHTIWASLIYACLTIAGAVFRVGTAGVAALCVMGILLFFTMLITGALCAFYLNVITETARGEDDLPQLTVDADPWNDVMRPLLLFMVSWVAVLLPAVLLSRTGFFAVRGLAPVLVVASVGVFFWPVTILTLAVGDSVSALRPDLIIRTVGRTFVPYLGIWASG